MLWHLIFTTFDRHRLFTLPEEYNRSILSFSRIAGKDIILFNFVDDHIHLVIKCSNRQVSVYSRSMLLSLKSITKAPLVPAKVLEVENRTHMQRLVPYILSQTCHHGLENHPAIWLGSCFQDIIGARKIECLHLKLNEALPRFHINQALNAVGLSRQKINPFTNDQILNAGLGYLIESSTASVCLPSALDSKSSLATTARKLVCNLGYNAGFTSQVLAKSLNITPRAARRLAKMSIDSSLLESVRLRMSLISAVNNKDQ